jgi:voltage-gated potassium channel
MKRTTSPRDSNDPKMYGSLRIETPVKRNALPRNYNEVTHTRRMHELLRQNARRRLLRTNSGTVLQKIYGGAVHRAKKPSKSSSSPTPTQKGLYNPTEETTTAVVSEVSERTKILRQSKRRHTFWYSMLNPHSKQWQAVAYKHFITTVIVSDLVLFIVSTDARAARAHGTLFDVTDGVVSSIFLLEYAARLYTITEKQKYGDRGPVMGRLYYAFGTTAAWIDLLATAPFFVELATGFELPKLTILRMFRLFRILKTESYIRAMDAVYRVIYFNAEILYVAVLVCVFLTLATAVLLYLLRPENDEDFNSIAATLYLSTLMLTGQGGPGGDLPWYTKAVVLLTSVFSVAMFAIPASMLTWGFEAEAARMAKRARKRALESAESSDMRSSMTASSSSDSSGGGDTTDDEYFKLIAGETDDDDDDESEETPWMKQIRQVFQNSDRDGDGTLTLAEATNLIATAHQGNLGDLTARVNSLEVKTRETNEKLDRILELLQ